MQSRSAPPTVAAANMLPGQLFRLAPRTAPVTVRSLSSRLRFGMPFIEVRCRTEQGTAVYRLKSDRRVFPA